MVDNGVNINGSGLSSIGMSITRDVDKLDDSKFAYYNFAGVDHEFYGWQTGSSQIEITVLYEDMLEQDFIKSKVRNENYMDLENCSKVLYSTLFGPSSRVIMKVIAETGVYAMAISLLALNSYHESIRGNHNTVRGQFGLKINIKQLPYSS